MKEHLSRRAALAAIFGGAAACAALGVAGFFVYAGGKSRPQEAKPLPEGPQAAPERVPKIDPALCKACGRCAKVCVRKGSAVKAQNDFSTCGYCVYCYGYYGEDPTANPDARICPTGALTRRKISEFRYEYTVDLAKCIGCGACVRLCVAHGNKSLSVAVKPELCLGCDDCEVLKICPHSAVKRA